MKSLDNIMTKKLQFIIIVLLIISIEPSFSQENANESFYFNSYQKIDPIGFINLLRENFVNNRKTDFFVVGPAPADWIQLEHISVLIKLIYCTDSTKSMVNVFSSFLPFKTYSCIGRETQNLINAFRLKDRYPNFLNSFGELDEQQANEIEVWWVEYNKKRNKASQNRHLKK